MIVDTLRQQHAELLAIANDLTKLLASESLEQRPSEAVACIDRLATRLTAHLELEDEQLYPILLNSDDSKIKDMAQRYTDEMGDIGVAFGEYVAAWNAPESIAANPTAFISHTGKIFDVLSRRIEREEGGLFPMVEQMDQV